jgi:hypothetical protein
MVPMIRCGAIHTAALLAVLALAGCASIPTAPLGLGPTGDKADAAYLTAIKVRDAWKYDLLPQTQRVVKKNVRYPLDVQFDELVRYEGYYDSRRNVTWVAVYGNVTSTSDYGAVDQNGYYVVWEQPGKLQDDFPPPWRLNDVELVDQPYN